MPSPFPGMDPYFEGDLWQTFHTELGVEVAHQLTPKLAPRYIGGGLRDTSLREELRQLVAHVHGLGRKLIAPRIEDAQSASLLWTAGVDYIQGDFVQQAGQDMTFDFHTTA